MAVRTYLVIVVAIAVAACGGLPRQGPDPGRPAATPGAGSNDPVRQALLAQYRDWRGTPYRYGGTSRRGVDCSGFVYLTLRERFGSRVPRTTAAQVRTGRAVPEGAWRPGDLVFFRTGPDKRHVGIYVDNGYFLHASSSAGVALSSLSEPYWARRYWQTRRLRP